MAAVKKIVDQSRYEEWVVSRPPAVRAVVERLPPDRLYRMKSTGQRCTIAAYGECEDGSVTLRVEVTGQYNRVLFSREVSGIAPDDLSECDLPAPGEDVGDTSSEAGWTKEDVQKILLPELARRLNR